MASASALPSRALRGAACRVFGSTDRIPQGGSQLCRVPGPGRRPAWSAGRRVPGARRVGGTAGANVTSRWPCEGLFPWLPGWASPGSRWPSGSLRPHNTHMRPARRGASYQLDWPHRAGVTAGRQGCERPLVPVAPSSEQGASGRVAPSGRLQDIGAARYLVPPVVPPCVASRVGQRGSPAKESPLPRGGKVDSLPAPDCGRTVPWSLILVLQE